MKCEDSPEVSTGFFTDALKKKITHNSCPYFLTHGSSSPATLFIESYLLACQLAARKRWYGMLLMCNCHIFLCFLLNLFKITCHCLLWEHLWFLVSTLLVPLWAVSEQIAHLLTAARLRSLNQHTRKQMLVHSELLIFHPILSTMKLIIAFRCVTAGDWQEVALVRSHGFPTHFGWQPWRLQERRQESEHCFSSATERSTYLFHLFDLARIPAGAYRISG